MLEMMWGRNQLLGAHSPTLGETAGKEEEDDPRHRKEGMQRVFFYLHSP